MITLTLKEAFQIADVYAKGLVPRMNMKAGYDFKRMRDEIQHALKPVHEQHMEIIAQFGGTVMPDGVVKWANPEGQEAADKEWNELLDKEIEIDREPIKLAAILGPDPAKYPEIQPHLLSILEKIIVE